MRANKRSFYVYGSIIIGVLLVLISYGIAESHQLTGQTISDIQEFLHWRQIAGGIAIVGQMIILIVSLICFIDLLRQKMH